MNQRIFDLAKAAELIQWDTLPSGERTPDHESVTKAEKFAQLIIRECIWAAVNLDDTSAQASMDLRYGRAVAAGKIREHFRS
jgi:hypothetical protein